MKKIIYKILLRLLVLTVFILVRPIRTKYIMKSIAINEFENIQIYDTLRKQLVGPVITEKDNYMEFKWYKVLDWGDTSAIHIDVYKRPTSFSWRDSFIWPRITMNHQWYYFLFPLGLSKFEDILPLEQKKTEIDLAKYKLTYNDSISSELINFAVLPDRLFYFLQKGHFNFVEQNDNCTIVDFYEPIANIANKDNKESIITTSAKVYVNDSFEILIMPYDMPIAERNK